MFVLSIPPSAHAAAQAVADRLGLIVAGLCRAIAARAAKDRALAAIVLVLWPYLHRVAARFARMVARWQTGRWRAGRPASPSLSRTHPSARRPKPLPHGFAWLVRLVFPEAAGFGSQLRALLTGPEFAAFLAAIPSSALPGVRRLFRPLCRMLGQAPADLPPALHPPPAIAQHAAQPHSAPRSAARRTAGLAPVRRTAPA